MQLNRYKKSFNIDSTDFYLPNERFKRAVKWWMDNRRAIFKREKDFHTTLYMIEFPTTLIKSNLTAIVRSYFLFLCYFPVSNIK